MGSTADHQHDFEEIRVPPKGYINHDNIAPTAPPIAPIPSKQWEKQPPCSITEQVVKDLKTRSALGLMKYGHTLDRKDFDLRRWLQEAYEECLDQAKYLKRAITELEEQDGTNRA
jgi:hypothetical protein